MAFLIVDPDRSSREAAAAMVTWVDRRHRVDFAEDGATAMTLALRRKPRIIFIEPALPDIAGEVLCNQLRLRIPHLTCVALSNADDLLKGFDSQLGKPPSRLEVLAVIEQSRQNGKSHGPTEWSPTNWTSAQREHAPKEDDNMIAIYMSLFDESLKFSIPIPVDSTVDSALTHAGKRVSSFTLLRGKEPVEAATRETLVQAGDHLVLKI